MADHSSKSSEREQPEGTSSSERSWSLHPNPSNVDQPSLKLILNASTSSLHQLPSYEDAVKSSSEETSDGRIISTCLNTGQFKNLKMPMPKRYNIIIELLSISYNSFTLLF